MMRKLSTWLLGLLVATMVSACCGSVSCECNDSFDDAIYFQFNLADSLGATGFRAEDVDTVLLVRQPYEDELVVPPPGTPAPPPDTARIIRSRATVAESIILNNAAPFTAGGRRKLDAYEYRLFVVRRPKGSVSSPDTIFYTIDQFQLSGKFIGDGCCTCYENSSKKLRVSRGQEAGRAGTLWDVYTPEGEVPKPVVLTR